MGCDGIIGGQIYDICGVCGGNNSSCRLVSGLFTKPFLNSGYNYITDIPENACSLNISEVKRTTNLIGLYPFTWYRRSESEEGKSEVLFSIKNCQFWPKWISVNKQRERRKRIYLPEKISFFFKQKSVISNRQVKKKEKKSQSSEVVTAPLLLTYDFLPAFLYGSDYFVMKECNRKWVIIFDDIQSISNIGPILFFFDREIGS